MKSALTVTLATGKVSPPPDMENIDFQSALVRVLTERNIILKDEQVTALSDFVNSKDVMAVLPTRFGKSMIYQLAPLLRKAMALASTPL